MPLSELAGVLGVQTQDQRVITDLVLDSRSAGAGTLFLAYPGTQRDGRDYIEDAQAAGAQAVFFEARDYVLPTSISIPAFAVDDLRGKVGLLAHHYFEQPSAHMQLFGVTGTNGKTTCCYLLTQALTQLGMNAAMIGTIGVGKLGELADSGQTTPDPISVHRLLATWRDQGVTQVCMEVSSHALDQGRVAGLDFFCALFTNLSHDHLDYHGDMSHYAAAKRKLFSDYASELVITNADDEMGAGLIDIANSDFIASYGQAGDVSLDELELSDSGMTLHIDANGVEFTVTTTLIGKVNVPNVLLLVTALLALSTEVDDIQRIVAGLEPAPGRMELHYKQGLPRVVVDYAHTPDALEKALSSLREHCNGQLWCVFGCGGDRDKDKRPVMGRVAQRQADQVVITSDNPRSEKSADIAAEITSGMQDQPRVILDRAAAIRTAIQQANHDDWILLAGKGHEDTQQIGDDVLPFSDREQVRRTLGVAA